MSNIKPLTHSEIAKEILRKKPVTRSSRDLQDFSGKYRDENVAEYKKKKQAFLAAARQYNKMNRETMIKQKNVLHSDYVEALNLDFLDNDDKERNDECASMCDCETSEPNTNGRLLRKRSLRPMHSVEEYSDDICLTEPWFKRHQKLNKFIWAARTVLLKNRLMKVLEKLKSLTAEDIRNFESGNYKKKCDQFHCDPIFEKFL